VTTSSWDPSCYQRFARERRQPFDDLCELVVPTPGMRVVDLGCGTGELTAELHRQLRAALTVGVERDEAMFARTRAGDGLRFERADLESFLRRPASRHAFDLLFSNAALHWVPDHERLMEVLVACLAPGGQLAFQVPANHDHLAHRLADEVAKEAPFHAALGGYQRGVPVLDVRRYAELLHGLGLRFPHASARIYLHELARRDDVLTWLRGSLLTAYQGRLEPALYEAFVARFRDRLYEALPTDEPLVFTYKRILVWGRKGAGVTKVS
jgi:trans-aconitate 2-methyltransferase